MRDKIEELLDMNDPMTKSHYMIWDSGDCSEVEFGEMEDPCSNCDDIDLYLDEICPECGRDQHSD